MKTKIKKIFITFSLVFIGISSLFALTYEELLQNYCNQDIQFEELTIAYQQAELSYEQTQINNGFSISAKMIQQYFPDNYTAEDMQKTIIGLLEEWNRGMKNG